MVEEEVDHFSGVSEDSEEPKTGGGAGVAAEGVEAGEEAAAAERFSAKARGDLPLLGSVGGVGMSGFGVPVDELGDVLEGLDELVDSVSLC